MNPTLTEGELIWFSSILRPKIGTIVLAKADDLEVVKRLHQIEGDLELVGDNTSATTNYPLKGPHQIIGRKLI